MAKDERLTAIELGGPTNAAREALARVSDEEWKTIILHLAAYAAKVSRHLRWRTKSAYDLPNGETPESIVSQAIEKVFTGERKWNPEEQPDLTKYLRDVIDSLMSHLANSSDNRLLFVLPDLETHDDDDDEDRERQPRRTQQALMEVVKARTPSPEQILLEKKQRETLDRALQMLSSECEDDELLRRMLNLMQDGVDKSGELAERLGVPVKEVYSASKRLERKYRIVAKQISAEIGANRDR